MMDEFSALPDTDGDGLHDAEEAYGWTVKRDLNGDGDTDDTLYTYGPGGWGYYSETLLPKGEGGSVYSFWKSNNSYFDSKDSDSDGLNDKEEKEHYTHPMVSDTDHDGLSDSYEIYKYYSDPKNYTRNWLIMVYMDGDNNLEEYAIEDVNEMEKVGSMDLMHIVIQLDRIPGNDNSNGDWTNARRYYITKDYDPDIINSQFLQDVGEVDMGDPDTLTNFVNWARNWGGINYPEINSYMLVVWDHGNGWKGVCVDDSSNNDMLEINELKTSLNSLGKLDIIGFDACLMQMVEVAYQIRGTADIMIGSEQTEPADGWPYDDIFSDLAQDKQMNISEFASVIVGDYLSSYNGGSQGVWRDVTCSAIWLRSISEVVVHTDTLAQKLISALPQHKKEIMDSRANTFTYFGGETVDLHDVCMRMEYSATSQVTDPEVQKACNEVIESIEKIVIAGGHLQDSSGWGLSIYWPNDKNEYDSSYSNIDFAHQTQWDEFLRNYLGV